MSTILQVVEEDLKKLWTEGEAFVEGEARILWADFKVILSSLLPSEYMILRNFVLQVLPDVATGNIAAIEAAVLNLALVQELGWIKELGSATLQAVIALIIASLPANQTAAANTAPPAPATDVTA
jgi:hypothetical protein